MITDQRASCARYVLEHFEDLQLLFINDSVAWREFIHSRFEAFAFTAPGKGTCGHPIDAVDLELEILQEQIAYAKQQRNKAVGACSLPPELLGSIFSLAQVGWDPSSQRANIERIAEEEDDEDDDNIKSPVARAKYTSGWMTVARTCSSWRKTALDTAALWTRLCCLDVHPQSIPTLLARSRLLPLSLVVGGSSSSLNGEGPAHTGSWISLPVLRYTQNLTLASIPHTHLDLILEALSHPMARLESARVYGRPPEDVEDSLAVLPADTFAHNASGLKHLTLCNVGFSWNNVLFSNKLTTLALLFADSCDVEHEAITDSQPSAEQLVQTISSMTALQELQLQYVFPVIAGNTTHSYTVTLPTEFQRLNMLIMSF